MVSLHALSAAAPAASSGVSSLRSATPRSERLPEPGGYADTPSRRGPGALRAALQGAVSELAGGAIPASDEASTALHDFGAALFEALRAEGAREVGHGPGRHVQRGWAWGRQGGDLAQRLEALAGRLGAPATGAGETPAPPSEAAPLDISTPTPEGATVSPPVDTTASLPATVPSPATATPLAASFAVLWQSLQSADGTAAAPDLAGFLLGLADRLGGGTGAPTTGSLVDTTA